MKDEDQRIDEEKLKIVVVLKSIFGTNDSFDDLKRMHNYKPIPLKRKGDFEYEVKYQSSQKAKDFVSSIS